MSKFSSGPDIKVMVNGKLVEDVESVEYKTWAEPVSGKQFGDPWEKVIPGPLYQLIDIKTKPTPWSDYVNSDPLADINSYKQWVYDTPAPASKSEGLTAAAAPTEEVELEEEVPYYAGLRGAMLAASEAKFWTEKSFSQAATIYKATWGKGLTQMQYQKQIMDNMVAQVDGDPQIILDEVRAEIEKTACSYIGMAFADYIDHEEFPAAPSVSEGAGLTITPNLISLTEATEKAAYSMSKFSKFTDLFPKVSIGDPKIGYGYGFSTPQSSASPWTLTNVAPADPNEKPLTMADISPTYGLGNQPPKVEDWEDMMDDYEDEDYWGDEDDE